MKLNSAQVKQTLLERQVTAVLGFIHLGADIRCNIIRRGVGCEVSLVGDPGHFGRDVCRTLANSRQRRIKAAMPLRASVHRPIADMRATPASSARGPRADIP
jgi:hypothetical protein